MTDQVICNICQQK